ncbi:MAG: peptidylprolyl isomerase [Bacteroidia bacterium]|nr:peptidylprolyl isomerase [Bacteroidia bacterium]
MVVINNKVVSLHYKLQDDNENGEVMDQSRPEHPLVFLVGAGGLLPHFEQNLIGLKVGDKFAFRLSAENGYGTSNPENVVDLDIAIFQDPAGNLAPQVQVGNRLTLQTQSGHPMQGMVKSINDDTVTMDFNHPMADKNLYFTGSITHIREASPEELSHGHVHGPGGHHHH